MEIVLSVVFRMTQQQKVRQGGPKPCHCSNQRGGIFKCRAQLGSRWDGLRLSFLNFKRRRPHWNRYKLGQALRMAVCLETHGHEDKFWNLGPMPSVEKSVKMVEKKNTMVRNLRQGLFNKNTLVNNAVWQWIQVLLLQCCLSCT